MKAAPCAAVPRARTSRRKEPARSYGDARQVIQRADELGVRGALLEGEKGALPRE